MPTSLPRLRLPPVFHRLLWIVLLSVSASSLWAAGFKFELVGPFRVGPSPRAPFAFDFDLDGHLDIEVTHFQSATLSLLLGDGSGSLLPFQEWETLPSSWTPPPPVDEILTLSIFDYDGFGSQSGSQDLLVGARDFVFIHNDIDATGFTVYFWSNTNRDNAYPAVGDFDGDGVSDLVYTDQLFGNVYFRSGVWITDFFPSPILSPTLGNPTELFAVNLNGDSHLDCVVGHTGGLGYVGALFGGGTGSFSLETPLVSGYCGSLALTDFDEDGVVDIVVVGTDLGGPNLVRVFLGDGSGSMIFSQILPGTSHPITVRAADLDGDQHVDLLVADGSTSSSAVERFLVYQGSGLGVFSNPAIFSGFEYTRVEPTLGDFDEDGLLDVVALDPDGEVFLHLNRSEPPLFRRGDADANGQTSALPDALFVLQYEFVPASPGPPCLDSADVNDDGVVSGLLDGLALLNYFFTVGGQSLRAPGPFTCGLDPTPDGLSCFGYPGCP